MLDLEMIRETAALLRGRCRRTELSPSHFFSAQVGFPLYFKCENLQRTGSFKIRGALSFVLRQSKEKLSRGVIAASAGNHAQGVAYAAAERGIPSLIVMPETTPLAKLQATRNYGAEVILHGASFDDALLRAREMAAERQIPLIPAFDDLSVMAGQGTAGLEIMEDLPDADTLVVPIGGGGLISGIATAAKGLNPAIRIIGVEAAAVPAACLSRRKGELTAVPAAHSLADGIAIKRIGELTFPIIERLVDEIVTVEEEEIAQAIVGLMEKSKFVVEGAGAVTLAAVLNGPKFPLRGKTICVLSGGNIDVQTMARVVERGLVAEGRYLKVRVELADVPGALASLAFLLGKCGANILRVSHDRHSAAVPLGRAEVLLEVETRGQEHIDEVLAQLRQADYGAAVLP